jgi:hypothetical protein
MADGRGLQYRMASQGPNCALKPMARRNTSPIYEKSTRPAAQVQVMLRDTPNWYAFTAVAATVLFKAFDTFATPIFLFASDFSSRTSDAVHRRRTVFFVLANLGSFFVNHGF